jgi:hypothetical protein
MVMSNGFDLYDYLRAIGAEDSGFEVVALQQAIAEPVHFPAD